MRLAYEMVCVLDLVAVYVRLTEEHEKSSLAGLLRKVHQDETASVSLETVLIVGAIALPILIFLIKIGWPTMQGYFTTRRDKRCKRARSRADRTISR